jgi:hypothetical protein
MIVMSLQESTDRLQDFRLIMAENTALEALKKGLTEEEKKLYKDELAGSQDMIEACLEEIKKKRGLIK